MPSPARSGSTHRTKICGSSSVKRPCPQAEPLSQAGLCLRREQERSVPPARAPGSALPLCTHICCPGTEAAAAEPPDSGSVPARGLLPLSGAAIPPCRAGISPGSCCGHKDTNREQPEPSGAGLEQREVSGKTCRRKQRWSRWNCPGISTGAPPQFPNPSGAEPWGCPGSGDAGLSPRVAE